MKNGPSDQVMLVLTNVPDLALARKMGAHLVEQKLAACVNILSPCESVYRWQGKVENAQEVPLLIKTVRHRYEALCASIASMHPYDVPEIMALPLEAGLPAYLGWVRAETAVPVGESAV
jgi:periplasmic divalent cation tolerance protein